MGLKTIKVEGIDAFIFDMDGVITETARVHAAAWKQMFDEYLRERAKEQKKKYKPFDVQQDYLRYVDGKPRYDGVKSFLTSRGISLPYGHPDDQPDKESICGLGNRKNKIFLERLKKEKPESYQTSVTFVKELKSRNIKVAVISASRNAKAVLEAAGVDTLFELRVDGVDSAEQQLAGKPAPAIFVEAAKRLDVKPANAAIVEDSLAGVEAGKEGNFKLVIGVDRSGQAEELRKRGADVVVKDLSELQIMGPPLKKPAVSVSINDLPSAMQKKEEIIDYICERTPAVFLDYDGTLTPIVEDPAKATISDQTRKVIKRLAGYFSVAVISGRDLKDVRKMVAVDTIAYAGSHGFDIEGPGGRSRDQSMGQRFLGSLDSAEQELAAVIEDIEGARIERKRFAIAVHYRQVADSDVPELERRFDKVLSKYSGLKKTGGKKIFEMRPDIDWDKGRALFFLLNSLYSDGSRLVPIYIGDDITDEDAFRAIEDKGIGIVVGSGRRKTRARYRLADPEEVIRFLQGLIDLVEQEVARGIWVISYDGYNPKQEGLREALCTLGNGFFATRGAAPESSADDTHYPGTYVAGCYNRLTTEIKGQQIENESLVNLPNWLPLTFRLQGGEWFDMDKIQILEYHQEMDNRQAILSRLVRFSDNQGRKTRVFQRRFVSMADEHLAGLETTIAAENWSGPLEILSALDGRVTNSGVKRYRDLKSKHLSPLAAKSLNNEIIFLQMETTQSHITIAEAAVARLFYEEKQLFVQPQILQESDYIAHLYELEIEQGKPVTIEKLVALYTSCDKAISECGLAACQKIERAGGFDSLLEQHILSWDNLWNRSLISVTDNERVAQVLHLHIVHLLQTVSPHTIERDAGVPPRGLHGEAYRGHILWDELFIFPFLNLRIPDITRALLLYRYRRLDEARWAAKQAGYNGAMYPWQSGSDGREESQKLHLNPRSRRWIPDNSQLQRHINIAIAYNVWQYYQVTNDINFLSFYGTEMLIEISRFWASKAKYNRSLDRYEIKKVMGPDEFHDAYPDNDEPGLDNNAYTNVMVVWLLCRTLEAIELLHDVRRRALDEKLSLKQEELEKWEDISRKMRVVFHDDGIISQFEGYDKLLEFDWEAYKQKYGNIHRLDRILEAEGDTPNRYKLSKQADVLMLFYLLSADELGDLFHRLNYPFEYETIPNNIEYYLKRTSHGSTLSRVVHAWVMARSRRELSWHLFKEALESDVSDIQGGTTAEGIHLGAMAGTVDLVQRCYTGIETLRDKLQLNPYLPPELKRVEFELLYRGNWVKLAISPDIMIVSTRPCAAATIAIGFKDDVYKLAPGETLKFDLQ